MANGLSGKGSSQNIPSFGKSLLSCSDFKKEDCQTHHRGGGDSKISEANEMTTVYYSY